jgi:hypothetical protein
LPPALFSVRDGGGDTYICDTGEAVDDPAVDIQAVDVFVSSLVGSDHDGLSVRVELGVSANETFANDFSVSVVAAHASPGETAYTIIMNEMHAGVATTGTLGENSQNVLSGTEHRTYIDEQGALWYLLPGDTMFLQIASFHTSTDDLPPDFKICDLAPSDGTVYTIQSSHP